MSVVTEGLKLNGSEARPLPERLVAVRRVVSRGIFLALLALIPLTSIYYGGVEAWAEAVFECAVFVLAAVSIVEVAIDGNINLKSYSILLPLLALVAFAFIQTIPFGAGDGSLIGGSVWNAISADPFQTRRWVLKVLALILFGAMLIRYTTSERRLRTLLITILLLGAACSLFGIFRQTTQRGKGFLFLAHLPYQAGYAQFINKNHFAFLAEMALGLALGAIVYGGEKKERKLIYLAFSLPVWAGLVLCNSRGGLFSMLGQLLFLGVLWTVADKAHNGGTASTSSLQQLKRSWMVRVPLLFSLLVLILVGSFWIGGESLVSRLETVPGEMAANPASNQGASRIETWRATVALIKEHTLFGVGFGGYWAVIPQYQQGSGELTPQEAHNDYLELLASGGIVGLSLVVWFIVAFIRRVRRVWSEATGYRRMAVIGALTGIFGVALHSAVDFGLHITVNALVFTALVVIATVDVQKTIPSGDAKRIEL